MLEHAFEAAPLAPFPLIVGFRSLPHGRTWNSFRSLNLILWTFDDRLVEYVPLPSRRTCLPSSLGRPCVCVVGTMHNDGGAECSLAVSFLLLNQRGVNMYCDNLVRVEILAADTEGLPDPCLGGVDFDLRRFLDLLRECAAQEEPDPAQPGLRGSGWV